jgi:hypothetical protein
MKQSRLLEIIREEIAGALNEMGQSPEDQKATKLSIEAEKAKIAAAQKQLQQLQKTGVSEVTLEEEKRKKLAEKYQLDEETINEMASIVQTKKALEKLGDEDGLELVKDVEKETLEQFKNSNPSMTSDKRLIRKLEPEEITGKRDTRGYGADFERNFKKKAGMDFLDFTTQIDIELKNKFPEEKFTPGLATNTTEKDAAAQIFGLEKGKQGRKADPNKAEKPAKEKAPKAEKTPKTKVATRTKGDDGFDDVSYSDVDDEDKEAAKAASSDETAKELGSTPEEKKVKFNQFLSSVKKNKEDKAKIDGILKLAKDKFKFPKTMMDDLKRAAGRDVEV